MFLFSAECVTLSLLSHPIKIAFVCLFVGLFFLCVCHLMYDNFVMRPKRKTHTAMASETVFGVEKSSRAHFYRTVPCNHVV